MSTFWKALKELAEEDSAKEIRRTSLGFRPGLSIVSGEDAWDLGMFLLEESFDDSAMITFVSSADGAISKTIPSKFARNYWPYDRVLEKLKGTSGITLFLFVDDDEDWESMDAFRRHAERGNNVFVFLTRRPLREGPPNVPIYRTLDGRRTRYRLLRGPRD